MFTTTGVHISLVPGIDTSFFLAVTIVYALVLSLGPLIYTALGSPGHIFGTKRGFRIAATITAVSVGANCRQSVRWSGYSTSPQPRGSACW